MQSLQKLINNHGLIDANNSLSKIYRKTSISFDFDPIYLICDESKFNVKCNEYIEFDKYDNQIVYVDIDITIKRNYYDRRKTI